MKARLIFPLSAIIAALSSGCISGDRKYEMSISRPKAGLYFVDIQWQTNVEIFEDQDWENKVQEIARPAIKTEFQRLGLPVGTISVGKPTPYRSHWVVVHSVVGDRPEDELAREAHQFWKDRPHGSPMPPSIYRLRGKFPKKEPDQPPELAPGRSSS